MALPLKPLTRPIIAKIKIAREKIGEYSMIAGDIVDNIYLAIRQYHFKDEK